MYESPQMRRLRSDLAAMERLAEDSSVLRFKAFGSPTTRYTIEFHGRSLARVKGKVTFRDQHEVEIRLGAAYPRTMPELRWVSPIYHPNISEIGLVCLGGYGTHWVPSLHLDDLCVMLWDMARYHNYDIRSPYNRDAALWAANQTTYAFPTDARPLRDLRIARGRIESEPPASASSRPVGESMPAGSATPAGPEADASRRLAVGEPVVILDMEVDLRSRSSRDSDPRVTPSSSESTPPTQDEVIFLD